MKRLRATFDEVAKIVAALLTLIAAFSLIFSAFSFFANRRPLAAEVDTIPLRGVRLGARAATDFQRRLIDIAQSLDAKTRDTLVADWARVGAALQSDTSVLILRITNRGTSALTNLAITVDFVSEFHDLAIDTNARPVLETMATGAVALYDPKKQQLVVQTFPRFPAKSYLTISVWGAYDLPPDLSVTVATDELGPQRPAVTRRVTGIRATIVESAHWITIVFGLVIIYYILTALERRKFRAA